MPINWTRIEDNGRNFMLRAEDHGNEYFFLALRENFTDVFRVVGEVNVALNRELTIVFNAGELAFARRGERGHREGAPIRIEVQDFIDARTAAQRE